MAQIITRLFSSASNAEAAARDLEDHRFSENEVFRIGGFAGATHDDLVAQIVQAGIAKGDAPLYAEQVQSGSTLLIVHAPFGSAQKATVLLDRRQPSPAIVAVVPAPQRMPYDWAAPLSSIFQWPTLWSDPAPLSSFFRWAVLSRYSLSRSWGYAELSDKAAPLSEAAKWPLLSENTAPFSARMKWPVLTSDPAPLSKRMSWATLSSDPAPLSRLLGIKVLAKHR